MMVAAALCTGMFAYLAVGACLGRLPRRRDGSAGHHRGASRWEVGDWLQQAGTEATPARFLALSFVSGVAGWAGCCALTRAPLVGIVPGLALAATPTVYLGRRREARMRTIQSAWPDALRDVLASITAGLSLHQAIEALAASGPPPIRHALRSYPSLAPMLGTVATLDVIRTDLADPTTDRVFEVLAVAHERGGSVVREILADLVQATTKDIKTLEEIDGECLEMRINANAVLVLPWLVLVALTIRPGAFRAFYSSRPGALVLSVAAAMSVAGWLWIRHLGRVPLEPRVLDVRRSPGPRS